MRLDPIVTIPYWHPLRAAVAVAGLLMLTTGCGTRNQPFTPPDPEVTVAQPLQRPVQDYFETTGSTAASKEVELRARVHGHLMEINFKDGGLVEEGQKLFVIDERPFKVAVDRATAARKRAEAQLLLAQQDYDRTAALVRDGATTQSARDGVQAQLESTKADVAAAIAAEDEARLNLEYTVIQAPFAGRITERMLDLGNLVQPGTSHLATIQAVTPVYAYFNLSEADLLRFMEMQRNGTLRVNDTEPLEIELALGDSDQFAFRGTLDYREFGIDPQTGTTRRRATFDNENARLIPGLFVRARARVGDEQPRLLVEEQALGADQKGDFLLVVDAENLVRKRPVKLGRRIEELRVILSGIEPDDWVIVNGLQRARLDKPAVPKRVTMGTRESLDAPPGEGESAAAEKSDPKPSGAAQSEGDQPGPESTPPAESPSTPPTAPESTPPAEGAPQGEAAPLEEAPPKEGEATVSETAFLVSGAK